MFKLIFPCAGKKGFKMSDMSIATELAWKLNKTNNTAATIQTTLSYAIRILCITAVFENEEQGKGI
jgi:hypothetical protein